MTGVVADADASLVYAPRSRVDEMMQLMHDSLRREFMPPDTDLLYRAVCPLVIFRDTKVAVVDGMPSALMRC